MIFEESKEELFQAKIPFPIFIPENEEIKSSIRFSYNEPISVRIEVGSDRERISIKESFMDWFYYGFPKNHMKSSVEYYGKETVQIMDINGEKSVIFSGPDYLGRSSSTAFFNGTMLEFRYEEGMEDAALNVIRDIRTHSVGAINFIDSSFLCNYHSNFQWFENERIGRLSWKKIWGEGLWNYFPDSTGEFQHLHKITIFRNRLNEFMWVDVSRKNSDIKNLRYRFSRGGNIFKLMKNKDNSFYGAISDIGPYLFQNEDEKFVYTVTVPRMKEFEKNCQNFFSHMENLNFSPFLP
jgi:hypothetical protein